MDATRYTVFPSPVGDLVLTSDGTALTRLYLPTHQGRRRSPVSPDWRRDDAWFYEVKRQLGDYFAGRRSSFDLPLAPRGTPFQRKVWAALRRIPYGQTMSYGELARRIGHAGAARAVGAANGQNPIAVIIPCHRVIGADGALTGYGGGLKCKRALLDLEKI